MKKSLPVIFTIVASFLIITGERLYAGSTNQSFKTQKSQTVKVPDNMKIPSDKFKAPKITMPSLCDPVGAYDCDLEGNRYRKCEAPGQWGAWVNISNQEIPVAEGCKPHECIPGEIICPFRDDQYRICQDNYQLSEWRNLDQNNDESNRVTEWCHQPRQCSPGQYRCFNDGGYQICDDRGSWALGGDTSPELTRYINQCVYRHNR